jgi:hypothetical protein
MPWAGPQATADAAGRAAVASGFPTADLAGWNSFGLAPLGLWAGLLAAPLAALALASAVAPRWRAGITLLMVALAGFATAFLAVGIAVTFAQGTPVAIWPGAGLSLAWIGIVGAALVTLDTALTMPVLRTVATGIAAVALIVCAVPALLAFHTDRSVLAEGPASTLPAYVAAQAAGDRSISTLVLTPQNDGGLAAEVVWGASETLGAQTTVLSTAEQPLGTDISTIAVDLLSARDFAASDELASLGVSYVLLAQVPGEEADRARALRTSAVTKIDQRAGFVHAGTTGRGVLWRVEGEVAEPAGLTAAQAQTAGLVTTLQLAVVLAALLLSLPTRASRRAARATSRIVGRAPDEPIVLPRRQEDLREDDFASEVAVEDDPVAAGDSLPEEASPTKEDTTIDPEVRRTDEDPRPQQPVPDASPRDAVSVPVASRSSDELAAEDEEEQR